MQGRGFIFSLDAFVAFTLIMLTISMLIFTIGTPKSFYPSLEQAHQLAYDGLQALSSGKDTPTSQTYLEQIVGNTGSVQDISFRVLGGSGQYRGMMPQGYGYRLEAYSFNSNSWKTIYDAGTDTASDRNGKAFTKLSASAMSFLSLYDLQPSPGKSPYCYLSCHGYPSNPSAPSCNATPCNISISNFDPGQNSIQIVRLVVYA